ncbi:MAG: acyl--CoA ligase [Solobacterium sp.]|jgi:long-subunit acyl-CoA synthetase (AMP-forming)|nr:acyl--CoA ligase [Solobacterium sp.]
MRYQNFKELLEINAKQYPQGTVFLVDDEGKKAVTWQSFYDCVQARAEVLSKEKSTCIGILCENAYACMVETFAANQAGKQIVLLDALASSEILKQQIQASDADQLYGAGERSAELSEALTKGCTDGKGKILFFTSGTASFAKAVVLSDASLMQSAYNGGSCLPLTEQDILLSILPLNHVFGFVCGVLWGMTMHAAVALGRGRRHLGDDCSFYHPTVISLVPMLLGFFLSHDLFNPECRLILVGAGDCPEKYFLQAEKKGIQVSFGYGLTETSSGVALSLGNDPSAMTVCPDDTITIASDGEILIQAPTCMMQGYYKHAEDTAKILQNGILHTGDLGLLDHAGKLHVNGRKKEVLSFPDGTKIFLPEYERALKDILHTEELTVILLHNSPVLVLSELKAGKEKLMEQISAFNQDLSRSHQITDIIALDHALYRTASGKVQRWMIQKEIEQG